MKNIIFDVDGTLWDTARIVAGAWNRAVSEVGGTAAVVSAEALKKEFGKTMDVIVNNIFPDAHEAHRQLLLEKCCECEQADLSACTEDLLYPHVKEVLEKLSGRYGLFIVSNCQSGYIELFMKKAGIERYITDFECVGNTGRSKGENIKLLMERNQLEDALYVGDTQGDYEATLYAGIPFVHAGYGFGSVAAEVPAIQDIEELLELQNEQ